MKGEWQGYYYYNSAAIQQRLGVDKTFFYININQADNLHFSGTVEDDQQTKGTPGTGAITGTLRDRAISFIKRMPVSSAIGKNGELRHYKSRHPPVYYTGTLSEDGKSIQGTWKFKFGFTMVGFLPMPIIPISGAWYMEKI